MKTLEEKKRYLNRVLGLSMVIVTIIVTIIIAKFLYPHTTSWQDLSLVGRIQFVSAATFGFLNIVVASKVSWEMLKGRI